MSNELMGRIRSMISRAIVALVDDSRGVQEMQIELLDGERQDGAERFGAYGLASHPHPEAEALAVSVGGLRSHMIVIAVEDRRFRLKNLSAGEVAIYDDQGQIVHLKRDGMLISSPFKVDVEAPEVTVSADMVNLGGAGGAAVARVGDSVAGGVITSGSATVFAS